MPEFDSTIIFKDVPGFRDFRVGTDGSLWSCRGKSRKQMEWFPEWKRLKPAISRGRGQKPGYPRFNLYANNRRHHRYLHHLILEVFIGPRPEESEVCHNDGNPLNNRLDNLRWGTRSENCRDTIKHGRHWHPFRGHPNWRAPWKNKAESQDALLAGEEGK